MSTILRVIALFAFAAASAPAPCEVYKWTDSRGKTHYSDKPLPGTAPTSVPVPKSSGGDSAFLELQGAWRVANTTMNGVLTVSKHSGSTWSFRNDELLVELRSGEKVRYTVKIEPGAQPKAFYVTPIPPSDERAGWMIYERERERLRLAFKDNLAIRPTGFQAQRKLVVFTLLPGSETAAGRASTTGRQRHPCEMLRSTGAVDLLGHGAQSTTRGLSDPITQCRFEQPQGAATLGLVRATDRNVFEKEREKQRKEALTSATPMIMQNEPGFGSEAFSVTRGDSRITFTVLKADTLVVLEFELPPAYRTRIRFIARRVIAEI